MRADMDMLKQLGLALQAGAELEQTLQTVADLARQILDATSAIIRLGDDGGKLVVRAISGGDEVQPLRDIAFTLDEGIVGQVMRDRQPMIQNCFDPSGHPFADVLRNSKIQSFICVPILSSQTRRAIGTLAVHNKADQRAFDEEDQATLSAFAAHAAVAVEKAVLREEQEMAAHEAAILHEVASATTSLNLSSVLSVAVDKIREVTGVSNCALFLYHAQRSTLRCVRRCGTDENCEEPAPLLMTADDPLFVRLSQGDLIELPDYRITKGSQQALMARMTGSHHYLIPMLNQQHLVGVLALTPEKTNPPLSHRQHRILVSVGQQIGAAIENARLYEETENRVQELSALQRISQTISTSLRMDEMLERVLEEVVEVMKAETGSVMLYEPERETLTLKATHGIPVLGAAKSKCKLGQGVAGWVALHQEPLLVGNLSTDPRFKLFAPRKEISSAIIVPMLSKRRLLGVLSISNTTLENPYTSRDFELMKTIAASFAVGIENAQNFQSERQVAQIARTALLPEVSLVVAGLEIGQKHEPAREVGGDYFHIFELETNKIGIVVSDVSGKSIAAAMHASMGKHFIRALAHRSHCPSDVLNHANFLIARETPDEIFISIFYGVLDVTTGELIYSNAGHVPPMIAHADGSIEELNPTGMLLGLWDTSIYEFQRTILHPGDTLLCYTDGVTEARKDGQLFGDERLRATLKKHASLPAQKIVDRIYRRTLTFCGKKNEDDLALLAIKRTI